MSVGRLPVFLRVGVGEEQCIGSIAVDGETVGNETHLSVDLAPFLREAADELDKNKES